MGSCHLPTAGFGPKYYTSTHPPIFNASVHIFIYSVYFCTVQSSFLCSMKLMELSLHIDQVVGSSLRYLDRPNSKGDFGTNAQNIVVSALYANVPGYFGVYQECLWSWLEDL